MVYFLFSYNIDFNGKIFKTIIPMSEIAVRSKSKIATRYKKLAEDIKANGLLSPLIVQSISGDKYKILAGRNRYNTCKLLELKEVACIIKDVDDLKAEETLINSNLSQIHELLPSEKAFVYKRKLELNRKNIM